uniref:Uncharacterized protein n=1 Tax=Megaselia scalaris TaxID=36166 RepID=T1H3Y7_MEGSC
VHKEIGTYSLTIKYNGTLRDDKLGFYRSNYTNAKGETVWLAATQFAPTYARSAFPCLDEPNKKATFDIKLTYPADKFAISNMPNSSFVVKIDADISIRPMTHYVETIDEIKKNYDKIAYEKSSCVLRMFDNAIGKDKFKKAVDMYLQNKSFKNAEEDDLFKYLEEAFKIYGDNSVNITKAMKSWTNQRGFPIVFANVNYREGTIELSQQRFVDKFQKDLDDPIYFIPINYISSKTERPKNHTAFTWFKNKTQTYQLPNEFSVNDWIVLNFEQTGYYRINYDNSTWSI